MTHEPGPERRATDGLDWKPPPPAAPKSQQEALERSPSAPNGGEGRRPHGSGVLAVTAFAAALAGALAGGAIVALVARGDGDEKGPSATGDRASLSVEQTSAISDVAGRARQSVVKIESTRRVQGGFERDVGSGVILDKEGHVLTNAHVVLNTEALKAILPDGTERTAILIGHDSPFTDLAVLQIGPGNLTPIEPGDSAALLLGQAVVAIGNPLAEFDGSVSVGVVSGLNRQRTFDAVRQDDLIQTDAAVNNGNSGGALVNLQGQFVGMPTAVLRQSRTSQVVEGIAFALPSNRLLEVAARIIAEGSYPRPSLSLEHQDIGEGSDQRFSVSEGAVVTRVLAGSLAAQAGIAAGDVITSIEDEPVNRQTPLLNALLKFKIGDTVKVVLNRNGRIIETEVQIVKRA